MKLKATSTITALGLLSALFLQLSPTKAAEISLEIQSVNTRSAQVEGSRGAALALLRDSTALLGGGERGDTLFAYRDGNLQEIGRLLEQEERRRDSRFGPTDVAILRESANRAQLLISYPQLGKDGNCVKLVVYRYIYVKTPASISKQEQWFDGKPCVPIGAVQHAAGRIEVINSTSAYLTTGDLGFRKIDDRSERGELGGVFKITANSVEQISQGHRNPQGILLIGKRLYISEHGPRGGDELNLIKKGRDYGWPFVTYGQAYGPGDYVRPLNPGTHTGFEEPLKSWVPSVAPTELIQLPKGTLWKNFRGNIVMGTLAEESLIFIELKKPTQVGKITTKYIGERIRDLELAPDGQMVATTDSGKLLFISLAK
jgi:glucose/arabinose dehydrogenase